MAVEHPRRNEHNSACWNRDVAGVIGIAGLSDDGERRRKEAQRLVHNRAGKDELWQGPGCIVRAEIESLGLRGEAFLNIGRRGDEP